MKYSYRNEKRHIHTYIQTHDYNIDTHKFTCLNKPIINLGGFNSTHINKIKLNEYLLNSLYDCIL